MHRPVPMVYRCIRATDGTTYLSQTGHTRAYLAPSAMLGYTLPLSIVYGSGQGAGVGLSTPELMPDPSPATIGGYYTWVRDTCHRLSPYAACAVLRKQFDANQQAIHDAFPDERPPLREKRQRLQARMVGCRS